MSDRGTYETTYVLPSDLAPQHVAPQQVTAQQVTARSTAHEDQNAAAQSEGGERPAVAATRRPRTARNLAGVIRARAAAGDRNRDLEELEAELDQPEPSSNSARQQPNNNQGHGQAHDQTPEQAVGRADDPAVPSEPVDDAVFGGTSPTELPLFASLDAQTGLGLAAAGFTGPGVRAGGVERSTAGTGGTSIDRVEGAVGLARTPQAASLPFQGSGPTSAREGTVGAQPMPGSARTNQDNVARRNQLADHELIRTLQRSIGERLAARVSARAETTPQDEEMIAQQVATEVVNEHVAEREVAGVNVFPDPAVRQATIHAAVDRIVKHGLLQPYLEREDVENIDAVGFDHVVLSLADGTTERVGPIASSDQDLTETIGMWASRVGQGEKQLSPSNPVLEMPLRDGSRLSATIDVSYRPHISIRRHRMSRVDLGQLIDADMCTEAQASFLAASVRAHRNIIVSGEPGSGKTTFLRALVSAIDPRELFGTIETDYELHTHENSPGLVKAWRARQGTGELRADGTRQGEITVASLMYTALRHNITRVVVGEVRSPVEIQMLTEAMHTNNGTMATVHARTATAVISRLVSALTSRGYSDSYARDQVGEHVDLIVHIETVREADGNKWRRVGEILEITQGEGEKVGRSVLFGRKSGEHGAHLRETHAPPQTTPTFLDALVAEGFNPDWLAQDLAGTDEEWA